MDLLVRLKFENEGGGSEEIITKQSSCQKVSQWYASHYDGDKFSIYVDGFKQKQDVNGVMLLDRPVYEWD